MGMLGVLFLLPGVYIIQPFTKPAPPPLPHGLAIVMVASALVYTPVFYFFFWLWNKVQDDAEGATMSKPGHRFLYRSLAVWFVLIAVEFVHGILRAFFLRPYVGDFRSRQIGVFTGSVLILVVAFLFIRWIDAPNTKSLIGVGLLWLILTVAFELVFGHFVFGRSWEGLFSDYDVRHGGFLAFGMAVLTFSPMIATRLQRR